MVGMGEDSVQSFIEDNVKQRITSVFDSARAQAFFEENSV
jgi:hypothetical protein